MRYRILFLLIPLTVTIVLVAIKQGRNFTPKGYISLHGSYTVEERLQQYGSVARQRLTPHFKRANVNYPPNVVGLLAIKGQYKLEVYAGPHEKKLKWVTTYPILRQSGSLGPKLREGDQQVPEGRYKIESMNPNSRFHLALRLNYPNDFDKVNGHQDGRIQLGSDIMIHGGSASIGCLAMGDPAIEDLFTLVADTGHLNTFVIITPVDFRVKKNWTPPLHLPKWTTHLYSQLRIELQAFPSSD